MASKSRKFWVETVYTRDDPPKTWTRVIGCYISDLDSEHEQKEIIRRAEEWLSREELVGSFCWVTARYGSRDTLDIPAFMFAFSDPNTAFAFKLRFG